MYNSIQNFFEDTNYYINIQRFYYNVNKIAISSNQTKKKRIF